MLSRSQCERREAHMQIANVRHEHPDRLKEWLEAIRGERRLEALKENGPRTAAGKDGFREPSRGGDVAV